MAIGILNEKQNLFSPNYDPDTFAAFLRPFSNPLLQPILRPFRGPFVAF